MLEAMIISGSSVIEVQNRLNDLLKTNVDIVAISQSAVPLCSPVVTVVFERTEKAAAPAAPTAAENEALEEAKSLIDGAYEIVFLHKPDGPAQVSWREDWLARAKKLGAGFDA